MSDTEPGREGPKTPQELQSATRQAYFFIPQYKNGKPSSFPENALEMGQRLAHRLESDTKLVLAQKFADLISQSPTTESFKELIPKLVRRVFVLGRGNPADKFDQTLQQCLQIDSDSGVYTQDGAVIGEKILFEKILDILLSRFKVQMLNGEEPTDDEGFLGYSGLQLKNFMLKWYTERVRLGQLKST